MKLHGLFLEIAQGKTVASMLIWVSSTLTKFLCRFAGKQRSSWGKTSSTLYFWLSLVSSVPAGFYFSLCVPTRRGEQNFKNYLRKGCYIIDAKPPDLWTNLASERTKLYFTRTVFLTWFACILSFLVVKWFYMGHFAGLLIT